MFGKSKSRKIGRSSTKDKENTSPFPPALASEPPPTPIWAQFSSQPLQDITTTSKVPLNDQRRSLEDEISLYTPHNYSPTKQRDFFEVGQPTLQKRPSPKERPKSMHVPKTTTTSLLDTFSRKKSTDRAPLTDAQGNGERTRDSSPSKGKATRPVLGRASTDTGRQFMTIGAMEPPPSPTKKPNRVMAAVAAFNGRAKQTDAAPPSPTKLDPKVVDAEFEEVLVRLLSTRKRAVADISRNHATSPHISVLRCEP